MKKEYITNLTFHYVDTLMDVLRISVTGETVKKPLKLAVSEAKEKMAAKGV